LNSKLKRIVSRKEKKNATKDKGVIGVGVELRSRKNPKERQIVNHFLLILLFISVSNDLKVS